jgi:hypothetical protein
MRKIPTLLVLAAGCSGSPLVESASQVTIVTNPGNVPDRPLFQLTIQSGLNDSDLAMRPKRA